MPDGVCSATCSLDGLTATPIDLPAAIADLACRQVSPDTFHIEERDRLSSLSSCSPCQISLFGNLQTSLTDRIGDMSTEQIAANLNGLYSRAYRYDPTTHTMDVANPQAKRELDLWIAVIDRRAHDDEGFLNRILERQPDPDSCPMSGSSEPHERSEASRDIEIVMALNSPRMNVHDRAVFHELRNGLTTWAAVSRESETMTLDWMRRDDGRTSFIDTPFWRSAVEFNAACVAWLGTERLQQISHEHYSEAAVREQARVLGMSREFESMRSLSDGALVHRLQDISGLMTLNPSPELRRRLHREYLLGNSILSGRDGDYDSRIRENFIRDLMSFQGFSRQDAELYVGPIGAGMPNYTASRLDDYQRRFELLGKYRDLYREFLTAPLAERFSPERMSRFNLWGQQILSGGRVGGAPITLEDIDGIRREIQNEVGVETAGHMTWNQFVSRDVRRPLFVRPDELGGLSLSPGSCSEPFAVSSRMIVNGRPLNEIIRDNVEYIAILPPESFPTDHAAGQAFYLFGVVILNGGEWRSDRGDVPSAGLFHEVLAHEVAGHEVWARNQFNDDPGRLTWLGVSERYAYATGRTAVDAYVQTGCAQPEELPLLNHLEASDAAKVRIANRHLGLDENDFSPRMMADHWRGRSLDYFVFQPGFMLGTDGREITAPADEVRALPTVSQRRLFSRAVDEAAAALLGPQPMGLESAAQRQLRDTIASLDRLGPNDVSPTLTSDHPLVRVFNQISGRLGGRPMDHMTFTAEQWRQVRVNVTATAVVAGQRDRQLAQQQIQDDADWRRLQDLRGDFWARTEAGLSVEDGLLLQQALTQIGRLEQASLSQPLVFDATHPLVRTVNRALEIQNEHATPLREIRFQDFAHWRPIELFLLRSFSTSPDAVCRVP